MKTNDPSSNEIINRMIDVDGMPVLIDRDVAMLYGVETKHINQAVKNNPDKFPEGYVITHDEDTVLRSKKMTAKPIIRNQDMLQKPLRKRDCIC